MGHARRQAAIAFVPYPMLATYAKHRPRVGRRPQKNRLERTLRTRLGHTRYDAASNQTSILTPSLFVTTVGYDPLNRAVERQHSSSVVTTQAYDPAGNVSGIANNGPSSLISRLAYAYNPANQRTAQAESDGTITTWTYDRAYRIVNESRAGGPAGTSFNVTHLYDPAGNPSQRNDGTTITTYTYTPANKLTLAEAGSAVTTYTNDLSGNRTAEIPADGDSTLFAWDAPGRMVAADATAGVASFTYNTDGQRVVKQSTDGSITGFLYDHKRLLQETDDVGGDVTRMYAASTSDEFGDLIGEDGEFTHVYDAQANTNALLDVSGQVEASYKYDAFGQVAAVAVEGSAWQSLTVDQWATLSADAWAGLPAELSSNMLAGGRKQYYLDPETELYLLGGGNNGRYYDPAVGRFVSEDPIRQSGGGPNLYAYVNDNPINHLDPSGHDTLSMEQIARAQQQAQANARQDPRMRPTADHPAIPHPPQQQPAGPHPHSSAPHGGHPAAGGGPANTDPKGDHIILEPADAFGPHAWGQRHPGQGGSHLSTPPGGNIASAGGGSDHLELAPSVAPGLARYLDHQQDPERERRRERRLADDAGWGVTPSDVVAPPLAQGPNGGANPPASPKPASPAKPASTRRGQVTPASRGLNQVVERWATWYMRRYPQASREDLARFLERNRFNINQEARQQAWTEIHAAEAARERAERQRQSRERLAALSHQFDEPIGYQPPAENAASPTPKLKDIVLPRTPFSPDDSSLDSAHDVHLPRPHDDAASPQELQAWAARLGKEASLPQEAARPSGTVPSPLEFRDMVFLESQKPHDYGFDPVAKVMRDITAAYFADLQKSEHKTLSLSLPHIYEAMVAHYLHNSYRNKDGRDETSLADLQKAMAKANTPLQNLSGGELQTVLSISSGVVAALHPSGFVTALNSPAAGDYSSQLALAFRRAAEDVPVQPGWAATLGRAAGGTLAGTLGLLGTGGAAAPAVFATIAGVTGFGNARVDAAEQRATGHPVSQTQEWSGALARGAVDAGAAYLFGKLCQAKVEMSGVSAK